MTQGTSIGDPWLTETGRPRWSARYHVPRSQVHEGSRGAAGGNVHLHVPLEPTYGRVLVAIHGRATEISRKPGRALCGKGVPWYDRPPMEGETRCPRCVDFAERYGIEWPK